jgi:acetyl-CoA carboxylase biotin carboxyl carrier protein
MSVTVLPLLAERADDGTIVLKAPKLGLWSGQPAARSVLGPGSPAGCLVQLLRRYELVVPEGAAGRVVAAALRDRAVPVTYGEPLFDLVPFEAAVDEASERDPAASGARASGRAVLAPTDGVYYRSATPGGKPYVVPGDRIVAGQVVGLIEVMKTFNPIVFEGAGVSDEAVVAVIVAADGEEVRAGSAILELR